MQNNRTHNRRTLAVLAVATAGVLALAGCTPQDNKPTPAPTSASPSPTPTSTTTGVPAPTNETEAIDGATDGIDRFLAVRGEVNAAGGTQTDRLSEVSTGPALQIALDSAARVVEKGWITSGALVFEKQSAYASAVTLADGSSNPFGAAIVTGCQDGSKYTITDGAGNPVKQPEPRNIIEFTVVYDQPTSSWLVQNAIAPGGTC